MEKLEQKDKLPDERDHRSATRGHGLSLECRCCKRFVRETGLVCRRERCGGGERCAAKVCRRSQALLARVNTKNIIVALVPGRRACRCEM